MARKKNYGQQRSQSSITTTAPPVANTPVPIRDFGKLRTSQKTVRQVSAILSTRNKNEDRRINKMSNADIIKILNEGSVDKLRELSVYFAKKNGIYGRAVEYFADIFRFDSFVYPVSDFAQAPPSEAEQKATAKRLSKILDVFDESNVTLMCRKWATRVCIEGTYYGYICDDISDKIVIQDLPVEYCRSRFNHRGKPLVEFQMQYFDKVTSNEAYKQQILALFPEEIQQGYLLFKEGNLPPMYQGDIPGWLILDTNKAFRFSFSDNELPPFLHVIPQLLSLEEVQDLEKERLLQQIQKILVQEFSLDKNGQLPFAMEELGQLNRNAEAMVGEAVGVSVLSTLATVKVEDLTNAGDNSQDSIEVAERSVYNTLGISNNLFNTDGNLALEKSVITDEAFVKTLLLQFEQFFNDYIRFKFNKGDHYFRFKMLDTTIFNYMNYVDKYRELTTLGFSRLIPMVALGHSQKEVTSLAVLEQDILDLESIMIPPLSSNTMNAESFEALKSQRTGRPSKPADQQSAKTIANNESITE